MTVAPWLMIALALAIGPAHAATARGNSALALAALVAEHSPLLNGNEKRALLRLLDGGPNVASSPRLSVQVNSVLCRASDVDITSRSCSLVFGRKTITVSGRKAHELLATILEVGVQPEGAVGSIRVALSHLTCEIDPREIQQKAGGGADCTFDTGLQAG